MLLIRHLPAGILKRLNWQTGELRPRPVALPEMRPGGSLSRWTRNGETAALRERFVTSSLKKSNQYSDTLMVVEYPAEIRFRRREILGCALVGTLGILLIHGLILQSGVYYYSDDVYVLYSVAVHRLTAIPWHVVRPLQYLIVLAANYVYLPLWLGASLLCVVGATILSALACERLFQCQLSKAGWWVLGLANPLLFYLVTQPDTVSQALCNILFAGALLAFISEFHRLRGQAPRSFRAESTAAFLNLMAAALFFTKETGVAAAIVIPAATALMRFKTRRFSPIFLFSLLLPIAAACAFVWLSWKFQSLLVPNEESARYGLQLSPIAWAKNFIITGAYPLTPLPSSLLGFEILRPLWVGVALGSVMLFMALLLHRSRRQPTIILPLLVVVLSCAPMILIRTDELYPSMIAPFVLAIVLHFGFSRVRLLSLGYGLLLYMASLANGVIYCLGSDFELLGLQHHDYSIYDKSYQVDPICPIATTTHVAWDETDPSAIYGVPGLHGRIICVR